MRNCFLYLTQFFFLLSETYSIWLNDSGNSSNLILLSKILKINKLQLTNWNHALGKFWLDKKKLGPGKVISSLV
jgi:hypothetical protein